MVQVLINSYDLLKIIQEEKRMLGPGEEKGDRGGTANMKETDGKEE